TSITRCRTCVPPGPSRKTAGFPSTVCARAGNCPRTQARSNAVEIEEDDGGICSVIDIVDILIRQQKTLTTEDYWKTDRGSSYGTPRPLGSSFFLAKFP